jgi:hypothetical protein
MVHLVNDFVTKKPNLWLLADLDSPARREQYLEDGFSQRRMRHV